MYKTRGNIENVCYENVMVVLFTICKGFVIVPVVICLGLTVWKLSSYVLRWPLLDELVYFHLNNVNSVFESNCQTPGDKCQQA